MFKKINEYLFRYRAKKYLSLITRERRFVNYEKAKTILLLFESEFSEKNPNIRKMIAQMQYDGKKVSAWGYIDKKEVATSILPDFRILHHKQTDFFQMPQISYLNELEDLEFDLLIDLSIHSVLPLQYIALYSNASCKIGVPKIDLQIYDFGIDIDLAPSNNETGDEVENPIDENYLFNQIIFYLKSIQTND